MGLNKKILDFFFFFFLTHETRRQSRETQRQSSENPPGTGNCMSNILFVRYCRWIRLFKAARETDVRRATVWSTKVYHEWEHHRAGEACGSRWPNVSVQEITNLLPSAWYSFRWPYVSVQEITNLLPSAWYSFRWPYVSVQEITNLLPSAWYSFRWPYVSVQEITNLLPSAWYSFRWPYVSVQEISVIFCMVQFQVTLCLSSGNN